MQKRILLISTDFFNYHQLIQKELESQGWQVTYLNDRPSGNTFLKILIRKVRFLIEWYLNYFYSKKIENLGVFDHVLIIKGEGITPKIINKIKKNHCRGKIYLYLWDGIKNSVGALENAKVVDKTLTFDSDDSEKFKFDLLPLFYVSKSSEKNVRPQKWNVSFVGSIHGDRLKVIQAVKKYLNNNSEFFIFVYFPSRLLFHVSKLLDASFQYFNQNELSLKSIAKSQADDIFNQSVAVLDIHHAHQTGLTMRTLEVLSLGKKLITTNEAIKKYSFYDNTAICVIDRKKPYIDALFFKTDVPSDYTDRLKPYELTNWVKKLTITI